MTTVHLLGNPVAGGGAGREVVEAIGDRLRRRGVHVVDLVAADRTTALAAAETAVLDGAERLIVVGGDGLVHLAVQAVAASDTVLGIVPAGTGNDFARGLGLPTEIDAATDAALGEARPIDGMRIGDHWAASVATLGFSVDVNRRANELRWPRGERRYAVATVLRLPGLAALDLEVDVDGTRHRIAATLVAVANTAFFGGGMEIAPGADPADGRLELVTIGDVGRLTLLRVFPKVFEGAHLERPEVEVRSGQRITLTVAAAHETEVWADGEPLTATPVEFEAVPGALTVAGVGAGSR